jgi:tetratricopeptide (TPR) repeat protein
MFREDYIVRMIKQFAEALARIARLRVAGDHRSALDAVARARGELFEGPADLDEAIDTATLARLLGHPDKLRAAAMLAWEDGRIHAAMGDPLTAFARYRRAHELYLEVRALDPQPDDESALLELGRLAPAQHLDPRYRGIVMNTENGSAT